MKIDPEDFRVPEGREVRLARLPTRVKPYFESKKHYKKLLKEHVGRLSDLQEKFYACDRYALLVIFQAMDAGGKDGAIAHVMSGVNPQGCQVHSFKHPSAEDLNHDFLWRPARVLPERGKIGIFNRSYYEEVLIVRVHRGILKGERVPGDGDGGSIWRHRYHSIAEFERHLHRNGTRIVKFFLHISKDEQRRRFIGRIDEPGKNWKISPDDIEERKFWKHYMRAYEECLGATSTERSPWYVVPADDKRNARLIVSQAIIDALAALKPAYPAVGKERRRELRRIRARLERPGG